MGFVMKHFVVMGLVAFAGAFPGMCADPPLPLELMHLLSLQDDEEALVDAVRRLDKQQQDLVEWDRTLAGEYASAQKEDLAKAKIEESTRRIDLVETAWRYALDCYPNNARANTYLGEVMYDYRGQSMDGVRLWLLALQLDEKEHRAHNNLGIHYFHSGDPTRGLTHLGRALKLDKKNPDYLYNLAQMYLLFFPDIQARYDMKPEKIYKEAMRLSREAAKFAPDDYEMCLDYAVNFFAGENFKVEVDWGEAAKAFAAARTLARTNQDRFHTYLNEARCRLNEGKPELAVPPLHAALELHPDSDPTKKLLERAQAPAAPKS